MQMLFKKKHYNECNLGRKEKKSIGNFIRIGFGSGADDLLVKLELNNGRIVGFWFQLTAME
jgi:hypothetical protein